MTAREKLKAYDNARDERIKIEKWLVRLRAVEEEAKAIVFEAMGGSNWEVSMELAPETKQTPVVSPTKE